MLICFTLLMVNNSKGLKYNLLTIYSEDSWIVYNFVGCGFWCKVRARCSIIHRCCFLIAFKFRSNPAAMYTFSQVHTAQSVCIFYIFYIAAGFNLLLKAIKKKHDKLWTNELWLCIKTTPNKLVHYNKLSSL